MSANEHKIRALELFDTLVELGGPEREPRLLALAQSDPELAQEVQRLLDADAAESGLLDRGVQGVAETVLSELYVNASASGLHAGTVIGSFTLLRPLGQGGMGEVWLAERRVAQADGDFVQQVALKLLKRGMDSDALVRRFVQERRILAELNHPHIARFVDGGISQDGRLYYAMEFVEGVSMLDYARQQKLNVRACVQLMSAVCDAVAHAQAHLVVHRDLKPSNILVDENSQPRVLDFGIAKLLDSSDPNQTGSEMRAMTPVYAAPEQILGEPISTATDVYALGVILYQLLTGTLPHQRSGTLISLADTVRRENIERPSVALRRSAQTLSGQTTQLDPVRAARELVGDLDTILLMALRREPARRYASAAAFGSDLRAWLAGMPVAAQLDTRGYRVRTFVRRNRGIVGGASAVFLALIAGLSLAIWQAGVAREQAMRADAEARRATLQATRAESVKDFVLALFQEQSPLTRDKARAATASELVERGIAAARSEFAADIETQAQIIGELAELQFGLGDIQQSVPNLQAALQLHEQSRGKTSTEYATTLSALGDAWLTLGETKQGTQASESALAILRKSAGVDSIETADAQLQMIRLLVRDGRPSEALPIAQQVYEVYKRERGALNARTLQQRYNVGDVLSHVGRLKEAEQVQREVIAGYQSIGQSDHAGLIYPQLALARMLKETGRQDESAKLFESALATARMALDVDHPMIARILVQQGDLLRGLKRFDEAELAWQGAEQIFVKHKLTPELAGIAKYRGALAMQRKQFDAAITQYEKALGYYQESVGPNNGYSYSAAFELAKARAAAGQTARAIQEGRAAYQGLKAIAEPGSSDASLAHYAWAEVLVETGQLREAETEFRKVLSIHSALHGSATTEAAAVHWKIAETLYAQNREVAESLALIEQTIKTFKANNVGDAHLGHALVLRGNLFDRAQNPQAAVRDWRDARAIFVAAYGTQDDRVLELTKLLAR